MARTSRTKSKTHSSRARSATRSKNAAGSDAIALLKADHREVAGWFEDFEKARSGDRKQSLARKICAALKVHTTIEEEIFYPAFLEATEDKDLHHEAEVEHDGAKKLIAEIEAADADADYFDARVTVLSEMIKHHVKEEEQRGGMFAEARDSDMDLAALGEQMKQRKKELQREQPAPRKAANKRSRGARAPASLLAQRNGRGSLEGARGRDGR